MPDLFPIQLRHVSLLKGGRPVLDDLTLSLDKPGITVILGPNGAGKSLLLRSLHGLLVPDSGDISLGGYSVEQSRSAQAMVFQQPVLLRRTAFQNLSFAVPDIAAQAPEKIHRALAQVRLTEQTHQPARMLSGGEQQRLALARALLTQPQLLLLDEATASLDPASVHLIESMLVQQAQSGVKVILISHDLGQARRVADEIVFMCRGKVVEQGEANRFFAEPSSAEARSYLAGELLL